MLNVFQSSPNKLVCYDLNVQSIETKNAIFDFFHDESIDFLRNPSKTNGKHTKPSNVEKVSEVE